MIGVAPEDARVRRCGGLFAGLAGRHYQEALAAAPDAFLAWLDLGNLAARRRDWQEARRCYQRAAALEPDSDDAQWLTKTLAEIGEELGQRLHWQPLSRGGSDASCSAAVGLTARPITLGFPVENSHGLEIMHRDSVDELARLAMAKPWRKACE